MSSRNKRRNKSRKGNRQNPGRRPQDHGQDDHGHDRGHGGAPDMQVRPARPSTETKRSTRTTELVLYVAAVLAVVMTALAVDADGDGRDPFGAEHTIRYVTFLTVGYMLARGLAKAGSHARAGGRRAGAAHDDDLSDGDVVPTDGTAAEVADRDVEHAQRDETRSDRSDVEDATGDLDATEPSSRQAGEDRDAGGAAHADEQPGHDVPGDDVPRDDVPRDDVPGDDASDEHLRLRRLEPRQ